MHFPSYRPPLREISFLAGFVGVLNRFGDFQAGPSSNENPAPKQPFVMLYTVLFLLALPTITIFMILDSYQCHRKTVKNQLINALSEVCIQLKADPILIATVSQRGHRLDDEEVLRQVQAYLELCSLPARNPTTGEYGVWPRKSTQWLPLN
ncbi:hypothetical protein ACFPMF_04885 [Larkinella bovis]|uniref:Uncharacterized protein n=1 Tax=Larkinella bovis TaxID=683041 RepID=A0ABW0I816_9BACT